MDYLIYFTGICLVSQAGQWHVINLQQLELIIGLRLYGVVRCRRLPDHISEGSSVLTNIVQQVVLECPGPCDPFLVHF